jgi:uncharacterized protein (UPF0332 family)
MAVIYSDFVDWVDNAQPSSSTEMDYRILAGRSYYAAYHAVAGSYTADKERFSNQGMHAQLINTLKSSTDGSQKLLGHKLEMCRNIRVRADYHLGNNFQRSTFVQALTKSKEIIKLVETASNNTSSAASSP